MPDAVWVLEGSELEAAVVEAGQRFVRWQDDWWGNDGWPDLSGGPVVFHGSARNADEIRRALRRWRPGAYADGDAFRHSAWRRRARRWLATAAATRRFRHVIAARAVVGGGDDPAARAFATEVAAGLKPPEEVYVMDVGEVGGVMRLLEIGPFSGADLCGCTSAAMVAAVSAVAARAWEGRRNGL